MFRLPDKHPVFNRSVLWTTFLFSAALFVPFVVAKSLPTRPQPVTVAPLSTPTPVLVPSPQQSQDKLSVEREWQQSLVARGLSWQGSSETDTSKTASKSTASKTQTSPSKSSGSKTDTSRSSKSTAYSPDSKPSETTKKQQSKSESSSASKQQTPERAQSAPLLEMRVAIANGDSSLVVGSSTPSQVIDAHNKVLGKLPANQGTSVLPDGQYIRIGKWQTPAGVWIKPAKGGLVYVGDRWYRGDLLLVSQGNSLLAVNYVDLESYIASVVGAEVSPSWPMAALKAQAIAARSYALVHYIRPASKLYDLGNTERWQVYRGIDAEWNTTRQAVQETQGVFLSYKGGVVESMYAASDDIVKDVFGGRGMSQNGALSLAQQGYNYKQILGRYYPGTGLTWIDTKKSDAD